MNQSEQSIKSFLVEPGYNIWKIIPDSDKNLLLIESRDGNTQTCHFKWIDLATKIESSTISGPDSAWWMSLAGFCYPYILFEEFMDEQDPSKKNLVVYDAGKEKIVLTKDRVEYHGIDSENIYINENGYITSIKKDGLEEKKLLENPVLTYNSPVVYPDQFLENDEYFALPADYLRKTENLDPVKAIDYLEHKNYICISYYLTEKNFLVNFLLVLNKKGEILFKKKLDTGLRGIGSDTFCIINDQLLFITNKSELSLYKLIDFKI